MPGARIPVGADALDRDLRLAEEAVAPVGEKGAAAALATYMPLWRLHEDWENGVAKIYVRAVAALPRDLIVLAMERLVRTSKFRPLPADIWDAVRQEMAERKRALVLLQIAAGDAKRRGASVNIH